MKLFNLTLSFVSHLVCAISAVLLISLTPASAQQLTAHRGTVENAYNYWFYTPGSEPLPGAVTIAPQVSPDGCVWDEGEPVVPMRNKPLVIFLHGASLCGRNLQRVRTYGTLEALDRGLRLDAYVLAPQNPGSSWNPEKINRIVDWAIEHYAIDSTRIYVLGMSLGGYGTIDYAATYPDRVAAAVAMCGGGTVGNYKRLCRVPLCIIHGTADRAVGWKSSQAVVDGIRAGGDASRLQYHLLEGKDHGAPARYFYVTAVYDWLFQHSITDAGRPMSQKYNFPFSDTEDCYRKLTKPEKPMLVCDAEADTRSDADDSTQGVHKVRQGDSLSRIAKQHNTTVARLCKINNIKRDAVLRLGQKIRY